MVLSAQTSVCLCVHIHQQKISQAWYFLIKLLCVCVSTFTSRKSVGHGTLCSNFYVSVCPHSQTSTLELVRGHGALCSNFCVSVCPHSPAENQLGMVLSAKTSVCLCVPKEDHTESVDAPDAQKHRGKKGPEPRLTKYPCNY